METWQLQAVDKLHPILAVDALSVRASWRRLEPRQGEYRWQYLDNCWRRCRQKGCKFVLRLMAGPHSPRWSRKEVIWSRGRRIPAPWDATHAHSIHRAIVAIAERYGNQIHAMHVPGFGASAETHEPKNSADMRVASAYLERVFMVAANFGSLRTIVNIGSVRSPWVKRVLERLPTNVTMQHNSLKASTKPDAEHHRTVADWPGRRGFQYVCPSGNFARFGGSLETAKQLAVDAGAKYLETYRGDCPR